MITILISLVLKPSVHHHVHNWIGNKPLSIPKMTIWIVNICAIILNQLNSAWLSRYHMKLRNFLTHWGWGMHIWVSNLHHHCFREWLFSCWALRHYLTQSSFIANWIHRNILHWNLNQLTSIFTQENTVENVTSKVLAILSQPQCFKMAIPCIYWTWIRSSLCLLKS